jgi:elongation factor Ts
MVKELREATGAGILDCKKALEATDGDFDKAVEHLREKGLAAAAKKASREAKDGLVHLRVDDGGQNAVIVEINCETDFVARTEDFQAFVDAIGRQVHQTPSVEDAAALLELPYIGDESVSVGDWIQQIVSKLGENIVLRRVDRVERSGAGWIEGYTHPGSRVGVLLHLATDNDQAAARPEFRDLAHDLALQIAALAPQYVSPENIPASDVEAERAIYSAQIAEEKKPDHIKERIVEGRLGKWYEQICLLNQPFIKDDSIKVSDLIAQRGKQLGASIKVDGFVRYELGGEL